MAQIAGSLEIEIFAGLARLQADMGRATKMVSTATSQIETAAARASAALAGIGVGFGLNSLITQIDGYTKLTAQLKLASTGATDYKNSLNDVRRIAKESQTDLSATAVLYARIANGTRELGVSQKSIANITETVNLALKVSGATATESASAMLQLSQAFGKGKLNGEEFNAISEASPRLMKALADGMGVPIGALKELATDGKITAEVMANVLPKALGELKNEAKSVQTISGAFTVLKNNVLEFVGVQSQASGSVGLLSGGIGVLANNINLLASAGVGFLAIKLSQGLINITTSAYASVAASQAQAAATLTAAQAQAVATGTTSTLATARVLELRAAVLASDGNVALAITTNGLIPAQARATVAAEAHSIALGKLTIAQRAASVSGAAASGVMSFLGGPIGLITTLLGLGVTAWMMWGRSSEDASKQASDSVEASGREIIANLDKQNAKLRERIALAKAGNVDAAKSGGADAEKLASTLTEINALKSKGAALTGSDQIQVAELEGRYRDMSSALATNKGLTAEIDNIGKQSKAAEWMEKLATKAEKMNAELKTAKKELGGAFTPEIEKRITEKYAEKATGSGRPSAEKISEYTRMEEAIAKVNLQATQELANGGKLASSDKFRIEEMQKITFAYATHKISAQERIKLIEQTTAAAEKMAEVEKRAAGIKADQANYADQVEFAKEVADAEVESSKAREQGRAVLIEYSKAIDAENKLTEFEISLIGQSDAARLKALELYRIEIELKKQLAAIDANRGYDESQRIVERAMAQEAAEKAKEGVDLKAKKIELQLEVTGLEKVADIFSGLGTIISGFSTQANSELETLKDTIARTGSQYASMFKDRLKSAEDSAAGLGRMSKALDGFANASKKLAENDKKNAAGSQEHFRGQISGYGDMAGAAASYFDTSSDGYKILTAIEQGFRAFEMASSIAAIAQKWVETDSNIAANVAGTGPAVMKGAAEMFAQSGWAGFIGVAAMLAVMASMGFGGGGSAGGTTGPGNQIGNDGRRATYRDPDEKENELSNYDPSTGGYTKQNKPQLTDQEVQDRANAAAIEAAANAVANLRIEAMKLTAGSEELEKSLARAKLAAGGMGKAQHELATQGMNEAELASYNYNQALMGQIAVQMDIANGTDNTSENMKKLAQESESLAVELLMASGDIAAARAMQRDIDTRGYTGAEVAVYDHNQAVRDAIDAANAGAAAAREAEQAERQLAQTRYELAGRLDVLLGRKSQLEVDRAAELLNVTDEAVISLTKMIWVIEDLKAAVDKSFAALQRAVEAERKAIAEKYKLDIDANKLAQDTQATALKSVADLFNALKSTVGNIEVGMTRDQAKSQLDATLNMARMTGKLPSADSMSGVLKALSEDGKTSFATDTAYKLDQARSAAKLSELARMAGNQVSVEQRTLDQLKTVSDTLKATYEAEMKRLDDVLSVAQKQLDKLNGIDTSVISVADAMQGFDKSLLDLAKAIKDAPANNVAAPTTGGGGGGGGSGGGGGGTGTNPDIDPPKLPEYAMTDWDPEIIKGYLRYYNRYPDPSGYANFDKSDLHGDLLLQAILGASAIDKEGVDYKRAIKRGYNPLDPIAKFAIGTNYVPNDMFAMVHKGERIIPAAENSELFSRLSNPQQNNAELVTELRAIRLELSTVKTELTQIKESNKKMKDLAEKDDAIGSAPARATL